MFRHQPCSPQFVDEAPHAFRFELRLEATPQEVFALISDEAREAEWFPDFRDARWVDGRRGAGCTRVYRLSYLTLHEEFLIWEPGARLTFWVSAASLPLTVQFLEDYRLTPRPEGGTLLSWCVCYRPRWWLAWLRPALHPFFARDFERAALGLCRLGRGELLRA